MDGDGTDADDATRRRRTRWLMALLAVLLVALGIVAYFLVQDVGGGTFAMPDVVGKPVATATGTLEQKGLVIGHIAHRSNAAADGTVLVTTPRATHSVKKGDRVTLVVSSGPVAKVKVPNVQNDPLASAEAVLKNTHLNSKVTFVPSSKPATTVISQSPAPTTVVRQGTTITLVVPRHSTTVAVPNVVGVSQTQARSTLSSHTLSVGAVTTACSSSFGKGLVASTSPAAGTQAGKGAAVALSVSSGPCQAPVPGVTGKSVATAKKTLTSAGFANVTTTTTGSCSPSQSGTVVKQTPGAGVTAPTSGTVSLSVCSATTTTTAPPTTTTTTTAPPTTTTTTAPTTPTT